MNLKQESCIDLERRFDSQYKTVYDESYFAEHGQSARSPDPFLLQIPCEHGHIFPCGGSYLGASTNFRGRVAKSLGLLPFVTVMHDGDDGITVIFDEAHFAEIARIMRPKRKRKLSPAHRTALVEAGAKNLVQNRRSKAAGDGRQRVPTTSIDKELPRSLGDRICRREVTQTGEALGSSSGLSEPHQFCPEPM